jgi:2-keto-3-deoxy-L-rhamnonate aldolase RhmA
MSPRRPPQLSAALSQGRAPLGTWVQMYSPETCELAAAAGFDFVIIDMEHGSFDLSDAVAMIRAVESRRSTPVVRVPANEPAIIKRVLDAGAAAVIVPGITSEADARMAIAATRFEPEGVRGACPCSRATNHGLMPWAEAQSCAHREVAVWLLIEHPGAVRDIEAIVALAPDAVVLGPFDLSMAMGFGGDHARPEVRSALRRVSAAASAGGIDCIAVTLDSTAAQSATSVAAWLDDGCTMATVLLDRLSMAAIYRDVLAAVAQSSH